MIGRRRRGQVEAPTNDIRVEDRRMSAGEPRGSRGFARLVVDYGGDPDRCMRVIAEPTEECVRDFVYFMSDRGTLAGEDSGVLADAAEEVFDEFLAANRDRRNWGLAKQMLRGGAAIVDEDDDRYVHLATFPPMSIEPPRATTSGGGQGAGARRDKRKASRAARRRNRR
jgi:hypothetical protein